MMFSSAERDQELPRERLELVLPQARVGEAHPEHQERDRHQLDEQHERAEQVGHAAVDAGDRPAAEEERRGERRERERGAELADEEEEEPEAGVLDHVAGDELGLSATGMSNGVWVSSACAATRNRKKPTNCVRMYGFPKKSTPKIEPFCWASTMPCRFIVPAWITTPTTASSSGSS